MATTEDRLQQSERLEELWEQPAVEPNRVRVDSSSGQASTREARDWSRPLLVGWITTVAVLLIFEPSPDDPAAPPLWGTILVMAFTYALFGALLGLGSRRPWGLRASALAGGLGMIVAGACAATGHHAGAWWMIEAVAFTGLTAGSLAALRARR